jgi:hypothetical protein
MENDENDYDRYGYEDAHTAAGNGSGPQMPNAAPEGMKYVDPLLHAAEAEGGGMFFEGDFIAINGQTGVWTRGADKDPIDESARFIVNVGEWCVGWLKMVDGKVINRVGPGRVADFYQRPPRDTLDDPDESDWPLSRDGKRREDAWKPTSYLPMRCLDDDSLVIFGPMNKTGCTAVADFVRVVRRVDRAGRDPVVTLGTRSFTNQSGGLTYVASFEIVAWDYWTPGVPAVPVRQVLVPIAPPATSDKPALAAPKKRKSAFGDLDDSAPF